MIKVINGVRVETINGVRITQNWPGKAYSWCTRCETGDRWSVPEFFFSEASAKEYAEKAPFENRAAEKTAYNTVMAGWYTARAARETEIGQPVMAEDYKLKAELYKDAAKAGRVVRDDELDDITWRKRK